MISFEEYAAARRSGRSEEEIRREDLGLLEKPKSQGGMMSFEDYAALRRSGYSEDQIRNEKLGLLTRGAVESRDRQRERERERFIAEQLAAEKAAKEQRRSGGAMRGAVLDFAEDVLEQAANGTLPAPNAEAASRYTKEYSDAQKGLDELDDQIAELEELLKPGYGLPRAWRQMRAKMAGEPTLEEQLAALKEQRTAAQERYDKAETDYGMYVYAPDYRAGTEAWEAEHAAGKSGKEWYDETKAEVDRIYAQVQALEQDKLAMAGYATDDMSAAWYEDYCAKIDEQIAALEEPLREAQRRHSWAAQHREDDLREKEDFAETAQKGLEAAAAEVKQSEQDRDDYMSGPGVFAFGDTTNPAVAYGQAAAAERYDLSDEMPRETWTEQERENFGYLYMTDRQRARDYAVELNRRKNYQLQQAELDETRGYVSTDEWLAARAAGLLSGADYMQRLIEYGAHGYTRQPDYVTLTAYSNAIDSEIAEDLNRKYGTVDLGALGEKGWGDAYQLGMSVIDSAVATAAGGEYGSLMIFFGKAASSAYDEAMQRGATPGQALSVGFAQGVAEALFEKFSVDKILDIAKKGTIRTVVKEILEAGAVEGSEELATSIANFFTDEIIADLSGGLSESDSAIRELMAQGASFEEARAEVVKSKLKDLAWDTVGGMLSGAVHAAGASTVGQVRTEITPYEGETGGMLDIAGEAGVSEKLLNKLKAKAKGGKLSIADVERLTRATEKQMDREDSRTRREAAEAQLLERGLDRKTAAELAAIIVKSQDGQRVTSREQKLFASSRAAQDVALEMSELGMRQGQQRSVELGQRHLSAREELERLAVGEAELPSSRGLPSTDWESGRGISRSTAASGRVTGQIAQTQGNDRSAWAREIGQYRNRPELYGSRRTETQRKIDAGRQTVSSLTPEVQTAKGAGKIVSVNPANGKVQVRLSDGTSAVMSADEAGLTGPARTLFDSLKELGGSAALAYASYTDSMDIDSYVAAWKAAEELGEMGLKPESVDKLAMTNVLPKEARDQAYRAGKEKAEKRIATAAERPRNDRAGERKSAERARIPPAVKDGHPPLGKGGLKRGSVSFEGGEAGGVTYKGVSDETAQHLTKKQEAAVSAAYAIAEITGFDFVFFEGDASQPKGIYKNGGTIFLNINAGKNLGRELVAYTMSHEITHAIQDAAPEQYEALRKFIAETPMEEGKFDALVAARRKAEPNLSFTEAVDEVVANGCETMLRDSEAIKELARQNRTLFEKIGEAIDSFLEKLRTAFGEARAESPEAQALVKYAEEIQKLWDEGLRAAVENRRAGKENAAPEGGVRYSISRTRHMSVSDQLSEYRKNQFKQKDEFYLGVTPGAISASGLRANPLVMDQTDFAKSKRNKHDVPDRVWKKLPSILSDPIFSIEYADRRGFLTKDIDRGGYPLVVGIQPDVDVDSEYVNKVKTVFGVIDLKAWLERNLRHSPTIRVYDIEQANSFLNSIGYYIASRSETVRSGDIVTLKETDVKSQNSVSDTVSDRSLLLEAAEREGEKAGEELKRFARRMEDLRGLQRRLERQQKKLAGMREETSIPQSAAPTAPFRQGGRESAEITALEGRIAETREAIAKTEARLDELERGAVLQREVKELRERWFSQNAAEAVEVQTEIQRENRELREALDFYKAQAKLTPVEQRRVRPQDVARFARALLKEHGSEADLDRVRGMLQEIGDYLVSGDGINGREYREQAREVARLIADEVYIDSNDAELYKELSQRVRGTRLQASEELKGDIPDYNAWRKSNLGRLTLANDGLPIDTFYQELGETYGEGLFPSDITAHSDQINRILEVLDEQRPKPVYALTEGERFFAIRDITNEIMDVMLSGEIREDETMADRNYRRMQEITRQAREQAREAKNTLEEERAYRKELVQARTKLIRQELQDSAEARQRRASIERLRKNLMRKLGENSGKRHVPENLKKALSAWLGTINTLSDFVSEERVRAYIEETDAVRQLAAKAQEVDYGAELDLPESLTDMLQQHINEAREAMKTRGGSIWHMSIEQLRSLEDALNIVTHAVNNANILLADAGHGHALDETAGSTLEHLDAMRKMKDMRDFRRQMQDFLAWDNCTPYYAFKRFGKGGMTVYREFIRGWSKMAMNARQVLDFAEQLYSADYAKGAEKDVYEFGLFRKAAAEEDGEQGERPGPYDENGQYHPENSGEAHGPKETVRITRAQLMSLYGLLKRQQAVGHVLGGGIRVTDLRDARGKKVQQAEDYILYEKDIAAMVEKLSAEDKRVVDEMIRYMSTVGSEWGNRVTMKRWGIRAFTEDSYFPIKTDQRQFDARTPEGQKAGLYRLLNMSFTKQTVKNANNAILLESVFDVFANHMADMAKYEALALPIVDAMRWYNFREISGEEDSGRYSTRSVQKSMERAYGKEAGSYFLTFLQDINGSQEGGRGEGRLKAIMSHYKVAAVGANLRVAIQQPTSIARAALLLDPKVIVRGAAMKGGIDEALKNSGLAVWKDLGYFDTNINRGIREQIKHTADLKDEVNEKAMWLAEQGDKMTWGALWNACKIEQAEKLGIDLKSIPQSAAPTAPFRQGGQSEEYQKLMEATAERFDEVIVATQVMDSTVTRSQIMRSSSALVSQLAAFKSEPTLTYNALMDAWMEYRMDARKGEQRALNKHWKRMGRTMTVWLACQALTGLAAAIVDACRDDDDYQTWLEKLLEHWGKNLRDNANIFSYLPLVDQVEGTLKGDVQQLMILEALSKMVTFAKAAKEKMYLQLGWQDEPTEITYYGKMTTWGLIYKGLQSGSSLIGLPIAGAMRDLVAIYNTFGAPLTGKKLKTYDPGAKKEIEFAWRDGWLSDEEARTYLVKEKVAKSEEEAEKILYQWGLDGEGVYDAAKKAALADDKEGFEKAVKDLEKGHYSRSEVESRIRTAVKEAYEPDEDGRQRLDKQKAIRLLESYGGLSADKAAAQVEKWTCFVVTGIRYDDIDEAYKNGEITESRARELRETYGGYSEEEAAKDATLWRWQKEHPEYEDLSESAAGKWYDKIQRAGISAEVWYDYCTQTKGQKKEDKLRVIQSLPLTAAQKDALYYAEGWAESKIGEAPWRSGNS